MKKRPAVSPIPLKVKRQALIAMILSCVDLLSANLFLIKCNPYNVFTDRTLDVDTAMIRFVLFYYIE